MMASEIEISFNNMSENVSNSSVNSDFKENFNKQLIEFYEIHRGNSKKPWFKQRVLEVIQQIKSGKVAISSGVRRTAGEYYWMSKYDITEVSGEEGLILKKASPDDPEIQVIATEDYFDILLEIHKQCGHGGRDKMKSIIKDKLYIQIKAIEIFLALCPTCDLKRNLPKKVTKPIVNKDFNIRGQVDLLDFQSKSDKEYKWLMIYQDLTTKFLHLRPLRSNKPSEVASEILFIFLEFGAPYILQSGYGREFTAKVLEEVDKLWPECKIVHGAPQHPQSQESVESNQDVENLLQIWMHDNNTTNWSIGCRFVQYQKNLSCNKNIGRSPYRALFGCDPKCGLRSSNIPSNILGSINSEEQLNTIINSQRKNIEINNKISQVSVTTEEIANGNIKNQNISQNNEITLQNNVVIKQEIELVYIDNNKNIQEDSVLDETDDEDTNTSCPVCGQETSGDEFCHSCLKPIHATCGLSNENEDSDSIIYCFICTTKHTIEKNKKSIKRAAEQIIDVTAEKHPRLDVGNTIVLDVPETDRGPLNSKTIVGKIVDSRHGAFQIGTKAGIIKNWFSQSDLKISSNEYKDEIPEKLISLREAVIKDSIFGGEGFQRCLCKPADNQCQTNRCTCFKRKFRCGSKCHSNLTCINK